MIRRSAGKMPVLLLRTATRGITTAIIIAVLLAAASFVLPLVYSTEWLNLQMIGGFIRLISFALALSTLCFAFLNRAFRGKFSTHSFPISLALGFTVMLLGYRYLIGAGIGYAAGAPMVPSGFLYIPEDNFSYAAWAAQAKEGAVLFQNRFTVTDHPAAYFNPFFLGIGLLSRLTGVPVIPWMILAGMCAAVIVILCAFYISRAAGLPEGAARLSAVLVAFSSGVSVPVHLLGKWMGLDIPVGADLRHMDSILFSTFYAFPYQSVAYALQAMVVLAILRCEKANATGPSLFILALAQLILSLTRPYEWVLLIGGYGLYFLFSFSQDGRATRLKILAILTAATLPVVIYNYWLSHQPVWESFAGISLSQQKFRMYWILGYGLVIPAAIAGAWLMATRQEWKRLRWITASAILSLFLLIIFNVKQVKPASCGALFLCITAGLGCHAALHRMKRLNSMWLQVIATIFAGVLFFGGSVFLMIVYFHNYSYDSELLKVSLTIRTLGLDESPKVLTDNETGVLLPVLAGAHVYSGHWALTPGYFKDKLPALQAAGVEKPVAHGYAPNSESLATLVETSGCNLLLLRKDSPAFLMIQNLQKARLVECYAKRCLYSLRLNRS